MDRSDEQQGGWSAASDGDAAVATPTLAEIYLKQGHTAEALQIYRRLVVREPQNATFPRKVAALEQRLAREQAEARKLLHIERLKRLLRSVQRRRRR